MTVAEWSNIWLQKYKKDSVRESTYITTYERPVRLYINPIIGYKKLTDILPVDIESLIRSFEKKYSISQLSKIRLCLFCIFETAIDNDLISKNPCKNVKIHKQQENSAKRTYTQTQVDSILAFSNSHKYGIYIRILLELGLRRSELAGLKWEDINFEEKTISIRRSVTDVSGQTVVDKPKSKSSIRTLPVSSLLMAQFAERRGSNDNYIVMNKPKPLNPKIFYTRQYALFFRDYIKSIENESFPVLTPHELRHTCGTLLYTKTKDIYAVSKYLGYSDISITTKLYVHESPDLLRQNLRIV